MEFSRRNNLFVVLVMLSILTTGVLFALQDKPVKQIIAAISDNPVKPDNSQINLPLPPQKLANPPEIIKAVYVTGYSAGNKKYLAYLNNLFKSTEINAVVIDIKDYSGLVSYNSDEPNVKKYGLYDGAIKDIDALVKFFHDQNIYVIGRIVVFEDPAFAKARTDLAVYDKSETIILSRPILWKDSKGLAWLDPSSKDVWDYNIFLAKDVLSHGFDEVNFDYVRFPSDGKMENMGFPLWDQKMTKSEIIKEFFEYTRQALADEKISVDLFGQTTVMTDDMGIGQIIENAFENFDYVSPMVYPSHYVNGFMGFSNPVEHPYEVIKYSMDGALNKENNFFQQKQDAAIGNVKGESSASLAQVNSFPVIKPLAKFRPWLQDFDMGADYNADMVKQEIKAVEDSLGDEYNGFMLWNPSNIYTTEAVTKQN